MQRPQNLYFLSFIYFTAYSQFLNDLLHHIVNILSHEPIKSSRNFSSLKNFRDCGITIILQFKFLFYFKKILTLQQKFSTYQKLFSPNQWNTKTNGKTNRIKIGKIQKFFSNLELATMFIYEFSNNNWLIQIEIRKYLLNLCGGKHFYCSFCSVGFIANCCTRLVETNELFSNFISLANEQKLILIWEAFLCELTEWFWIWRYKIS